MRFHDARMEQERFISYLSPIAAPYCREGRSGPCCAMLS